MPEAKWFDWFRRSVSTLRSDFVIALRRLRATPLFTTFAVLSLAAGVGVTTAAYSAMYALGMRPTGVEDDSRFVLLSRLGYTTLAPVSWADYQDLVAQQRSFGQLVAWAELGGVLVGPVSSERIGVEAVSGHYFNALGIRASIGRPILASDDRPDAPAVLVLADSLWRRQFASDPQVIGKTVRFAQQQFEIVGVAPASFRGAGSPFVDRIAAWVPLAQATRIRWGPRVTFDPAQREPRWLSVGGRLRPDATPESAALDIGAIARRLDEAAPLPIKQSSFTDDPRAASQPVRAWGATSLGRLWLRFIGQALPLAIGLPLLVLLVACTNLANLVHSRGTSRRHEVAIRGALGATRWRLVQEHLMETAMIAAIGGLLAVLIADGLLAWAVFALRERVMALEGFPLEWHFEPVVFAAAGLGALLSLLVAGLAPALQMTRVDPGRTLTIGDSSAALPRWRWRGNLIALQVGVSTALFLITVIGVRFLVIEGPDRPWRPAGRYEALAVASVSFDPKAYDVNHVSRTARAIVEHARRLPDVAAATASTGLPMDARRVGVDSMVEITRSGQPFPPRPARHNLAFAVATLPALDTMVGLDPVAGRFVRDADRGQAVAVSTDVATRLFGSTNVVGQALTFRSIDVEPGGAKTEHTLTIVGVVSPPPTSERSDRRAGLIYLPFEDRPRSTPTRDRIVFVARTSSGDATNLVTGLRSVVRQVDQDLAVVTAGRADILVDGRFAFAGVITSALGSLATLSLVLAMVGLYGVLSHVVSKRTREMGIRLALGAAPARITMLVLKQGLRPVIEGLLIGLCGAVVLRQLLQMSVTSALSTVNVATFALAAFPLLLAGSLAVLVPAYRASRVDPNVALRNL